MYMILKTIKKRMEKKKFFSCASFHQIFSESAIYESTKLGKHFPNIRFQVPVEFQIELYLGSIQT